jgi:hypothetical protein
MSPFFCRKYQRIIYLRQRTTFRKINRVNKLIKDRKRNQFGPKSSRIGKNNGSQRQKFNFAIFVQLSFSKILCGQSSLSLNLQKIRIFLMDFMTFLERTLPHKHVNLAPYVALVITKIFFEINMHQPLSFENLYWKPCNYRGNIKQICIQYT